MTEIRFKHMGAQKENADPRSKLLLRRYFLDRYHGDAQKSRRTGSADGIGMYRPQVFDACQAGGLLWTELRKEYHVKYWGVDLTKKSGRLMIDSTRILEQSPLPFDIIDVDTYGAPWRHWLALLPHLRKPTTVFLTVGHVSGIHEAGAIALEWLGIASIAKIVPNSLRWKVVEHAAMTLLAAPYAYGLEIVEVMEATRSLNARYIGVRLNPAPGP